MLDFDEAKLSIKIDDIEEAEENETKLRERIERQKRQARKKLQAKKEHVESFGLKRKYGE